MALATWVSEEVTKVEATIQERPQRIPVTDAIADRMRKAGVGYLLHPDQWGNGFMVDVEQALDIGGK